ncbi:hypothetical protein WA026_007069 [Henosepilachna vigintioctopunctata]|uniref:Uncharacterized protein n=1 Tax=Henosepilachna vigintioctopunctata TaxID=420089 RepID=A0AAW1V977_9CUCU
MYELCHERQGITQAKEQVPRFRPDPRDTRDLHVPRLRNSLKGFTQSRGKWGFDEKIENRIATTTGWGQRIAQRPEKRIRRHLHVWIEIIGSLCVIEEYTLG